MDTSCTYAHAYAFHYVECSDRVRTDNMCWKKRKALAIPFWYVLSRVEKKIGYTYERS